MLRILFIFLISLSIVSCSDPDEVPFVVKECVVLECGEEDIDILCSDYPHVANDVIKDNIWHSDILSCVFCPGEVVMAAKVNEICSKYDHKFTDIYCPLTKKHLYTYTGDIEKLNKSTEKDFILVEADRIVVKENEMKCPFDDSYLNGYIYWWDSRGYNLPRMAYPAVTVMTKSKNGDFKWSPHELSLEDN